MEFRCEDCNKNFNSQESLEQHNSMKHSVSSGRSEGKKTSWKKYIIFIGIGLIIVMSAYLVYANVNKPGQYDNFAKCLTEKGAVVYGNDYCQYTVKQLNFFGKSKKYLNYVKCSDNEKLCDEKGIQTTPTWEINGEMYVQIQTFERLAAVSGCEIG